MSRPTVGVIGNGVVGNATARSYVEWTDVKVYDVVPEKSTHRIEEVLTQDVVFVCLPTPQIPGKGKCDTSALDLFFERTDQYVRAGGKVGLLVIRSTVPIGYTRKVQDKYPLLDVIHSPEFLTARCSLVDACLPSRNIIGIPERHEKESEPEATLRSLYSQRFPSVTIYEGRSDQTEAVKLFTNSFFAAKVALWNEMFQVWTKTHDSASWEFVHKVIMADGRIHPSHTQVPGPDGKLGFGGACLPKDLTNLIDCAETEGVSVPILRAVQARNQLDRGSS